jgi:hypothetical protein
MRLAWRVPLIALLAAPALALGWFGHQHLSDGLALDAAIPVPNYLISGRPMPPQAYQLAARSLAGIDRRDTDGRLALAQVQLRLGTPSSDVKPLLENAILASPANARAWLLFSETLGQTEEAQSALANALLLAPYDYYLAVPRAVDAAIQWDHLDDATRQLAGRQIERLWDVDILRPQLRFVLAAPNGALAVTQSFAARPDDLRELNRFVSKERRMTAPTP